MINTKELINALDEIEATRGISKMSIIAALKEALEKAYCKQLGAGEDAHVRVDIEPVKGTIAMYQLKDVVAEVEDDFLQISLEDAQKINPALNIGDVYQIEAPTEELTKMAAITVKNILRQKLAEAEKAVLYENYKDKIGEMIVGVVEKVDERSTILNIGRMSVFLPNSQRIPGEVFKVGDRIKLYVGDVISTTKGAQISVSRTDAGFLRRIFEEEIHEIYDGTVVIKDIAREAGERSKVAVYSTDPNVDPAGACIGPNGTRIAKIVSQLGSSKEAERIDIITYNSIPGIYIMEALKPADVVGVILNEEKNTAIAVVNNNESSKAIGKKGINARLAVKLTKWNIEIKELDEAIGAGLKYMTADDLRRQDELRRYEAEIEKKEKARLAAMALEETKRAEVTVVVPVVEETVVKPIVAPVVEQPKPEIKVEPLPVKKTVIRTTKKLEELERELEKEKLREQNKPVAIKKKPYKKYEKKEEVPATKPAAAPSLTPTTYMDVYSEEELQQIEAEEKVEKEEDIVDFEEFEDYYEEE